MSTVVIKVASVDYTADVVFGNAEFESKVNGATGTCKFRVRDDARTLTFVTGSTIELIIDGNPVWTGYLETQSRVYAFPAENVTDAGLTRWLDITGSDLNVLFQKRIVYDKADPTVANKTYTYPPATADNAAIAELVTNWLDLSGDGLDTSTFVTNVANINVDQDASPWSSGQEWGQAMMQIASLPGAVFFIDPARNLVYVDVNTATAPYAMSDQPTAGQAGYREMTLTADGTMLDNDFLAWGTGYGSQNPVFDRVTDAPSVALHGLWQAGQLTAGVFRQATIDRIATSVVDGSPSNHRGTKDDRTAIIVVTYVPGFLPAQKVDFTSNIFGFNDVIPIRGMRVTFDAPDTPKYELTISHAIDSPFGFFDPYIPVIPPVPIPKPILPGGFRQVPCPDVMQPCADDSDFARFDDFDRVVVRFPPAPGATWGQASGDGNWTTRTPGSENTWVGGSNSANPSNLFRGFSAGFLYQSLGDGSFPSRASSITSGPWQAPSFTMTALVYLCGNGPGFGSAGDASPLAGSTTFEIGGNQGLEGYLGETPLPKAGVTLKHGNVSGGSITPYSAIEVHAGPGGAQVTDEVTVTPYTAIGDNPSFIPTTLGAYYVKWAYRIEGMLSQAKVWAVGSAEPSWQVSVDTSTYAGSPPSFNVFVAGSGFATPSGFWASKAGVDYIDFCAGESGPATFMFDDPTRRVVNPGWGASSYGFAWSGPHFAVHEDVTAQTIAGQGAELQCPTYDGFTHVGYMQCEPGTGVARPWGGNEFTVAIRFLVTPRNGPFTFGVPNSSDVPIATMQVGGSGNINQFSLSNVATGASYVGSTVTNTWMRAKIHYIAGVLLQGKIWVDGDPEPAWQATDIPTTSPDPNAYLYVTSPDPATISAPAGSTLLISEMTLGCYANMPPVTIPFNCGNPGDRVNETPVWIGGGDVKTRCSYQPGSMIVFRNGLIQRPVTDFAETAPSTGLVTLGDAVSGTDKIEVMYVSGGTPT